MNRAGIAPLILDDTHAGNIGLAIADKEYSAEWNGPLLHRLVGIDLGIIPDIEMSLVDSEEKLRLGRVVHCESGPAGNPVLVIHEGGGVDLAEVFPDLGSLDHLLDAGGNNVVLQPDTLRLGIAVDSSKPSLHSGEELNIPSMGNEGFFGQLHPILHSGLFEHEKHVAQDRICLLSF